MKKLDIEHYPDSEHELIQIIHELTILDDIIS